MENYSLTIEIPTLYVQDAKFYKKDTRFSIKLISYVTPRKCAASVQEHNLSKSPFASKNVETNDEPTVLEGKASIHTTLKLIKTESG